jgi:ethanolamine utilization protein EutN
MFIAKVKGNVVTTQKVAKMTGRKLLIVEPLQVEEDGSDFKPTGKCLVAVDNIDAGTGDVVLVTQGSSARLTEATTDAPVDCVVIGIVDNISLSGKAFYDRSK